MLIGIGNTGVIEVVIKLSNPLLSAILLK